MSKIGSSLLLTAALATPGLASAEDFTWRGHVASGRTLEVKGVNGSVAATAAAGNEIEVRAVKSARRSDPLSVEVKVVEHADGVTICAVYPTPSDSKAPNECVAGSHGRMNTRDNDVQVNFTIKVPSGVRFVGRTVNGQAEAIGLEGDAEVHTVNGSVKVETRGTARASTVNGSISASMGRSDWSGTNAFKTVNGEITLDLPADLNTEVTAKTVNGGIDTDFPLTVKGQFSRRSVVGTIGTGGRELDLSTVNGSIRLRKK